MEATRQSATGGRTSSGGQGDRGRGGWTVQRVTAELREVLEGLAAEYAAMVRILTEHAQAIRSADAPGIGRCTAAQEETLARLSRLDLRRREVVAGACSCVPGLAEQAKRASLTVTQVAAALPGGDKDALVASCERVKALVAQSKALTEAVRISTVSLMQHVEGVMRQVSRKLSHAGTYGRRGVVETTQQVVTSLDMRS
ncbi:MAG: flagellar export chaperone FlgN [Phycisphaerales bacterium]|jgi:hypothetical protein